jgi:hypothetical protein
MKVRRATGTVVPLLHCAFAAMVLMALFIMPAAKAADIPSPTGRLVLTSEAMEAGFMTLVAPTIVSTAVGQSYPGEITTEQKSGSFTVEITVDNLVLQSLRFDSMRTEFPDAKTVLVNVFFAANLTMDWEFEDTALGIISDDGVADVWIWNASALCTLVPTDRGFNVSSVVLTIINVGSDFRGDVGNYDDDLESGLGDFLRGGAGPMAGALIQSQLAAVLVNVFAEVPSEVGLADSVTVLTNITEAATIVPNQCMSLPFYVVPADYAQLQFNTTGLSTNPLPVFYSVENSEDKGAQVLLSDWLFNAVLASLHERNLTRITLEDVALLIGNNETALDAVSFGIFFPNISAAYPNDSFWFAARTSAAPSMHFAPNSSILIRSSTVVDILSVSDPVNPVAIIGLQINITIDELSLCGDNGTRVCGHIAVFEAAPTVIQDIQTAALSIDKVRLVALLNLVTTTIAVPALNSILSDGIALDILSESAVSLRGKTRTGDGYLVLLLDPAQS